MAERRQAKVNRSPWSETGAIAAAARIDDWISICEDGTVTVFSGKVELGTGVRTALAQIVAEELDVSMDAVRMVMGETGRTPDEGYTAGSKTIQFGGFGLRIASAAARRALLELASRYLNVEEPQLSVSQGRVSVTADPSRSVSYAELLGGRRFNRDIGEVEVKDPASYRIVGTTVPRLDLPKKFTGVASFVQDIRIPGMLHARLVRPPRPGAHLRRVDETSVGFARVVRAGDFLAVVAEREEVAAAAARGIAAEWEGAEPLPDPDEVYDLGEVNGSLASGGSVVEAEYRQPYQAHASIGPSCAVADYREDGVTVWSSTQGVYPLRGAIADFLRLSPERVTVIHTEGSGCYGQNGADDVAADAAFISRAVGRPVRVQWSRSDEFAWEPYGPAMVTRMRGAVHGRKLAAWIHETWTPSHAYRPRVAADLLTARLATGAAQPPPTMYVGGDRNAATDYEIPEERVLMHWLERSPLRVSSFRSLGAYANAFANESFMDELANTEGIDPVAFRLSHISDPRGQDVVRQAAEASGWGRQLSTDEGLGIAYARYENREAYVATVAHVHVDRSSGRIRLLHITVAHDCGLIINPDGLRNQIEGNIIQGASRALKEQVTWDKTRISSTDWKSYPILTFTEVPTIDIILLDRPKEKAVGAGEPAIITVAPAVANAVFSATGARLREVPFTPARVKAAF